MCLCLYVFTCVCACAHACCVSVCLRVSFALPVAGLVVMENECSLTDATTVNAGLGEVATLPCELKVDNPLESVAWRRGNKNIDCHAAGGERYRIMDNGE